METLKRAWIGRHKDNPDDPENFLIFGPEADFEHIRSKMTLADWEAKFHELLDSYLIEVPPDFYDE